MGKQAISNENIPPQAISISRKHIKKSTAPGRQTHLFPATTNIRYETTMEQLPTPPSTQEARMLISPPPEELLVHKARQTDQSQPATMTRKRTRSIVPTIVSSSPNPKARKQLKTHTASSGRGPKHGRRSYTPSVSANDNPNLIPKKAPRHSMPITEPPSQMIKPTLPRPKTDQILRKPNTAVYRRKMPAPLRLQSLPPPDIDLTLPLPPGSPSDDPLLLVGSIKPKMQRRRSVEDHEDVPLNYPSSDDAGDISADFLVPLRLDSSISRCKSQGARKFKRPVSPWPRGPLSFGDPGVDEHGSGNIRESIAGGPFSQGLTPIAITSADQAYCCGPGDTRPVVSPVTPLQPKQSVPLGKVPPRPSFLKIAGNSSDPDLPAFNVSIETVEKADTQERAVQSFQPVLLGLAAGDSSSLSDNDLHAGESIDHETTVYNDTLGSDSDDGGQVVCLSEAHEMRSVSPLVVSPPPALTVDNRRPLSYYFTEHRIHQDEDSHPTEVGHPSDRGGKVDSSFCISPTQENHAIEDQGPTFLDSLNSLQPALKLTGNNEQHIGASSINSSETTELEPIVEISSQDPKAAARAVAILKLHHKYEETANYPQTIMRPAIPPDFRSPLRDKSRRSIPPIPASPSVSLPDVLREAEMELTTPHRARIPAPPLFSISTIEHQHTPASFPSIYSPIILPTHKPQLTSLIWTKDEWRCLDRCFTDERIELARRFGAPAIDVDQVDLEAVVDRFLSVEGRELALEGGWSREKLLRRAEALKGKQRANNAATDPGSTAHKPSSHRLAVQNCRRKTAPKSQVPESVAVHKLQQSLPIVTQRPNTLHLPATSKEHSPPMPLPMQASSYTQLPEQQPTSATKRVLSWMGSFLPHPPVFHPKMPSALIPSLPDMSQVDRNSLRHIAIDPSSRVSLPRLPHPKEQVHLTHVSPRTRPIVSLGRAVAKPIVIPNANESRRSSGGSVRELVRSFEELRGTSEIQRSSTSEFRPLRKNASQGSLSNWL